MRGLLREMEARKKRMEDERRRRMEEERRMQRKAREERERERKAASSAHQRHTGTPSGSQHAHPGPSSSHSAALSLSLPPKPPTPNASDMPDVHGRDVEMTPVTMAAPKIRRPPPSLIKARIATSMSASSSRPPRERDWERDHHHSSSSYRRPSSRFHPADPDSSSSTPLAPHRARASTSYRSLHHDHDPEASPASRAERSPSPVSRMPGMSSRMAEQVKQREAVLEALSKSTLR